MPLQKRPVTGLDDINQRRRDREVLNQVLDHSFDDSRRLTDAEKLAGIMPVNFAYPPNDMRRFNIPGDGVTNVKAIFQHLFSLDEPILVYKPDTAYYLGQLSADEQVFDFTAKSPWIVGQEALFTCDKPATGIAVVFSLGGGCKNFHISGIRVQTSDYTIAGQGSSNGVVAVGVPEDETVTVQSGYIDVYAEDCIAGLEIFRADGTRHFDFEVNVQTRDCYYGLALGGSGESVRGRVESFGQVRTLILYGTKDVDLTCISSNRNSASSADCLIKTFADGENTRNIRVRFTATDSVSTNPVVRFEHEHVSSATADLRNVDLWLDDSGNSSSVTTSVIFSARMDGSSETPTSSTFDNIFIRGNLRGQLAFDTQPSTKALLFLETSREYFGRQSEWSTASEGYIIKASDGHYWQCTKGDLSTKVIDIPINKFLTSGEWCLVLDIYGIADVGTTSSSVVRREQITVFGYGASGPTIRSQTSNFNANTSANIAFTVAASGNNIRISFSGSALTTDGAASVFYRFI
jgi:hypothetical protein